MLQSRVGPLLKSPEASGITAEMIAVSDEGSNTDLFADLDEVEDQTEEN